MRPREPFVYRLPADWGDAFRFGVLFGAGAAAVRVRTAAARAGQRRGRFRRRHPDLPSHIPRGARRHWAELFPGRAGQRGGLLPDLGAEAVGTEVLHTLARGGGLLGGSVEPQRSPARGGGWTQSVDARTGADLDEVIIGDAVRIIGDAVSGAMRPVSGDALSRRGEASVRYNAVSS
jgi:hypothetical protein